MGTTPAVGEVSVNWPKYLRQGMKKSSYTPAGAELVILWGRIEKLSRNWQHSICCFVHNYIVVNRASFNLRDRPLFEEIRESLEGYPDHAELVNEVARMAGVLPQSAIEKIPPELIGDFLKWNYSAKDFRRIGHVCKEWRALLHRPQSLVPRLERADFQVPYNWLVTFLQTHGSSIKSLSLNMSRVVKDATWIADEEVVRLRGFCPGLQMVPFRDWEFEREGLREDLNYSQQAVSDKQFWVPVVGEETPEDLVLTENLIDSARAGLNLSCFKKLPRPLQKGVAKLCDDFQHTVKHEWVSQFNRILESSEEMSPFLLRVILRSEDPVACLLSDPVKTFEALRNAIDYRIPTVFLSDQEWETLLRTFKGGKASAESDWSVPYDRIEMGRP